jgi:hypothetical protein
MEEFKSTGIPSLKSRKKIILKSMHTAKRSGKVVLGPWSKGNKNLELTTEPSKSLNNQRISRKNQTKSNSIQR